MAKRITAADLLGRNSKTTTPGMASREPEAAKFYADELSLTVTAPDGSTVFQCRMLPRGFKPKERRGQVLGGVGWFMEQRENDEGKREKVLGSYQGQFPVSANVMLFLDGVKVEPGTVVDLTDSEPDPDADRIDPRDPVWDE